LSFVLDLPRQPRTTEGFARVFLIRVGVFNFCAGFEKSAGGGGGHGVASVGRCGLFQYRLGGSGIFCFSRAGVGVRGIVVSVVSMGWSDGTGAE